MNWAVKFCEVCSKNDGADNSTGIPAILPADLGADRTAKTK